jgi:dipeptidyl aminopeptidase/acylaminoacyl peptidase
MSKLATLEFGIWPSPIPAQAMGRRLGLLDVMWDTNGRTLAWLERRPSGGMLVARDGSEAMRDLTPLHDVRGRLFYGGGEFTVAHGVLVFAGEGGRLFRQSLEAGPTVAITPPFGSAAAPEISPDGRWVVYVHSCEGVDRLALVDADGSHWPTDLVSGADFYMQPNWHPFGDRLAWVEWDHPNMPWDGSRLMLGRMEGTPPRLVDVQHIAGGDEVPVFQPAFSPEGNALAYLQGEGEWDQLCLRDLVAGTRRIVLDGTSLMPPAWLQGMRTLAWSSDGRRLFVLRNEKGFASLWAIDVETSHAQRVDIPPYTWISQLSSAPRGEALAFIGSAPTAPERVVVCRDGTVEVVRRSQAEEVRPEDLPAAQPLSWAAPDGTLVHGLCYAPTSRIARGEGLPPAILDIHSGPTRQRVAGYSAEAAFFATRGYAVLALNYRGSSGYGRSYMRRLREHWGEYDVEDAIGGAGALVEQGLADPRRMAIMGTSAGGFTVLNVLARHPGVFRAGVCSFGISNLFTVRESKFKFEAHYLDSLVGRLPEAADRYRDRSPLFHVAGIRDPLALFHGEEDTVVPLAQTETIAQELAARGVAHHLRRFAGEGHGWRREESVTAFYTEVEAFLRRHVVLGAS